MREIKFRGKSLDSGEWYYGNLYDKDTAGRTHIGTTKKGCLNIDPDTVGQYTGLKDKNGVEIYEGDIVETVINGFRYVQEVVWSDIKTGFSFRGHGCGPMFHASSLMEVIGNIHDNPELIK